MWTVNCIVIGGLSQICFGVFVVVVVVVAVVESNSTVALKDASTLPGNFLILQMIPPSSAL